MHRIDGTGATSDNLFTEGDPTLGIPATSVTGAWLNAVQEEIAHAIEDAGVVLAKSDNRQLVAAIRTIASQATGWSTGDVKLTMKAVADSGWLMCNDGTIGNASSAATARASNDCQALFTLLWNNIANAQAPVSGGRGASASADWSAGKTIGLTKMLGRALGVAGSGSSLTARAIGEALGAETHALTTAQMPAHNHAVSDPGHAHSVYDPGHAHLIGGSFNGSGTSSNGGYLVPGGTNVATSASGTGISIYAAGTGVTTQNNGSGQAHPIMQPTTFLNVMIKL